MEVFRRIVLVAGLAGLAAGLLLALVHSLATVPIILKAEVYEDAAAVPAAPMAGMAMAEGHDHGDEGWKPADGVERTSLTVLADLLTAIGFGLLLVAAYTLSGDAVGWRRGLLWGLAGFATFSLAPSLGLPPEVPGTEAAPLLDRQLWWLATAAATGGGLALMLLVSDLRWKLAGAVLMVLPHLYGAPQPLEHHSAAPDALAHEFVVAVLAASLIFWLALGALSGLLYRRLAAQPAG